MNKKKRTTTDAIEILDKEFYEGDEARKIELAEARAQATVARKLFDLRKEAGLSQRALAKLVGTTASVICRLEDADYEGHSLAMLNRIAVTMNKKVEITFVSVEGDEAA